MTRYLLKHGRSQVPLRILFLVGAPLFLGSCSSATAPVLTTWEGALVPELPHVVTGRIAAVTQFGRTSASVQLEEGDPDLTYGWRINEGSCQAEGDLQGGPASYPPLNPSDFGTASGETTIAEVFREGDAYAVRVFLAAGGGEEIVACGELTRTQ